MKKLLTTLAVLTVLGSIFAGCAPAEEGAAGGDAAAPAKTEEKTGE